MQLYIWDNHDRIKQKLFMQKLEGSSFSSCYLFSKLFIKNSDYLQDQDLTLFYNKSERKNIQSCPHT